ncbi:MAG TPA: hypothetical protein P5137_05695, partial [Candidatus Brocadiia bacterium]|nr:hypothetical protein [Candidatus Brocadiia bacterium]
VVEVPLTEYQKANLIRTPKGQVYYPALTQAPARQPPPAQAQSGGLFWWSIGDGAMQTDTFAASAVNAPVRLRMARDGSACAVVVVEAAQAVKDISITAPGAVKGVATLTVQRARVMPQLLGYRSSLFAFIPEILDPLPKAFSLAPGERAQFFIRAHALPMAHTQGSAAMTLTLADGRKTVVPIEVSVAPFALAPCPADFTWGLYPDPGRWEKYTDAQLDAELRWLRQCGMTTLLLYPPYQSISEFGKLDDSKADAAVAAWKKSLEAWGNRYLRAFERAGFGPRYVCNIQSLSKHLSKATGIKIIEEHQYDTALLPWVRRYVAALEEVRRANNWPFFYYHLVDEPGGSLDPRANAEFSLLKQLGLHQYTTANHENVVRDFRDKLDVFCCASGVFRVQASVERIRSWLKDYPNAQVWQYGGAGAYSGQEGRIAHNRFGSGLLSWKLGVSGLFLWTFQRMYGEPANDFDDAMKDAAMTYPAPGGGASLSTLQWEGVCQGIEDYRHLRMIETLVAQRLKEGGPAAAKAKDAAAWLAQFKQSLWTYALSQPPSNALMDQWRGELLDRIAVLN